jgi:CheY-like chemotaxis protein
MDLRMPRMDGFEAIRRMRAAEKARGSSRTPILVVSAHTDPQDVAEAQLAGADDHIGKPVNAKRLLDVIGRRVRLPAP